MDYIFEDKRSSKISGLLRKAYPDSVSSHFFYSNGSGNLINEARKRLRSGAESVGLFVDFVVDNEYTWQTINKIFAAEKEESLLRGNLVVVPIPCIEYFYIKSLAKTNLARHTSSIETCLEFKPYIRDPLVVNMSAENRCRTHEKFCKFILNYAFYPCVRDNNDKNSLYAVADCLCSTEIQNDSCKVESLADKALRLASSMRLIPCGSMVSNVNKKTLDLAQAKATSLELLNELADKSATITGKLNHALHKQLQSLSYSS